MANQFDVDEFQWPNNQQCRMSLAYGHLKEMPHQIVTDYGDDIHHLDLSYNRFTDLSFLQSFPQLQTLVLDRNLRLDCSSLPLMSNLRILWLNNCNLINIDDWLEKLRTQCPQLKDLSMMCNPVGHTVLNGVTFKDEIKYRRKVSEKLPQLNLFDGVAIAGAPIHSESFSLDNTCREKIRSIRNFSSRLHKNFTSIDSFTNRYLFRLNAKHSANF